MRLFIAVELPEVVRQRLANLQSRLRVAAHDVSWTKPENLHITLKFLGEASDEQIDGLCRGALGDIAVAPMRLRPHGIVLFPPGAGGPVRIVACGFAGDVDALCRLQADVESACQRCGIPREGRKFTPHATLARARRRPLPPSARRDLEAAGQTMGDASEFACRQFVLMHSELSSAGSRYTAVARFPRDEGHPST